MKAPVAVFKPAAKQPGVKHVAGHALKCRARQPAFIRARTQQGLHPMPARKKFVNKV
jgi:hypothetical protein